jgi:muramoyltetrapeptide carboxypeptidase
VGGFTNCKDTERGFGKSAYEIIHEHINDFAWPVCFGFPVSHDPQNVPLKSGARYKLDISASKVILKESSSDNQKNV